MHIFCIYIQVCKIKILTLKGNKRSTKVNRCKMNCKVYSFKAQTYNDIHLHTCSCPYMHTHSVQNKSCALNDIQNMKWQQIRN